MIQPDTQTWSAPISSGARAAKLSGFTRCEVTSDTPHQFGTTASSAVAQEVRLDWIDGVLNQFIPWSKYPIDLGHNIVLADSRCNSKKRDRMPHVDHLARWTERNRDHAAEIVTKLKDQLPCDLACTNRIARWAYEQTETAGGLTWDSRR